MDGKNVLIGLLIFVGLGMFWYYNQTPTTGTISSAPAQGQAPTQGIAICPTVPTVNLGANDKYDAGQTNWGTWKYKLDGATSTDTDGSFTAPINKVVDVLVADANGTAFYRSLWKPAVERCDVNQLTFNNVIKKAVYDVVCYNELGQPINGTQYFANYANLSIGSGGCRNVKCELTGTAKTGMPDLTGDGIGGELFLELNSTTYKENDLTITWDGASLSSGGSYGAYKLSISTGSVETFKVPSFEGAVTKTFYVNVCAETDQNPGAGFVSATNYADSIVGYLIPENCYEEEDVTPTQFICGIEDKDSTFTAPGGTVKASASIATFAIPVQ